MKRSESVSREGVVRAVDGDERGRELSPAHPDRVSFFILTVIVAMTHNYDCRSPILGEAALAMCDLLLAIPPSPKRSSKLNASSFINTMQRTPQW